MKQKILITGACGVTSRAIARSLKISSIFENATLLGTDVCDNAYGLYEGLFAKIWRVPHVSDPSYAQHMHDIVKLNEISAAIIIPELEVLYWSEREFFCPTLLPPPCFSRIAVSKARLYESLKDTKLIPQSILAARSELIEGNFTPPFSLPCWIRDVSDGATSGKGALLATTSVALRAWAELNPTINTFMISEFLPGRNIACHLLYDEGRLLKVASYERLEYFMGRTVMSGVSGNISKGRLINDKSVTDISIQAVDMIANLTGETMNGIVAVDLRESSCGLPMVTEINLRHVACTYSFAAAGFNLAEAQLLLTLGQEQRSTRREQVWPTNNAILRDIDGEPIWVPEFALPAVGDCLTPRA